MYQRYHARVYVTLRPSVLDPAGAAVETGLHQLGYEEVSSVRIGKYIEFDLTTTNQQEAETQLQKMCVSLLANTVIENYCFELDLVETIT